MAVSDYYSESRSNTDWPGRWKKKESELNRVDWPNFRRDAGLMNAIQTKPRLIDQLLQRCKEDGVPEFTWADSDAGNPEGRKVDGRFVTAMSLRMAWVSHRMSVHLPVCDINDLDVLEIGGGFGALARTLQNVIPVESYTFIDAKPMLKLQKKYMEMLGNPIPTVFYYEPQTLDEHLERRYDVFVNTHSLGEMPLEIVKRYFDYIQSTMRIGGMFYSFNRKHRDTHYSEYPFDDNWKFLEVKEKDWMVPWVESVALRT